MPSAAGVDVLFESNRAADAVSDINECSDPDLNDCDVNARCDNFEGGYSCACKRGFKDNGDARTGECERTYGTDGWDGRMDG